MGINDNFTFTDKLVTGGLFFWSMLSMAVVVVVSLWNLLVHRWSNETWASYWFVVGVVIPMIIAMVTLVWFGIGGILDLRAFFHRLATMTRDVTDDGTVGEHGDSRPPAPGSRFEGVAAADTAAPVQK
jgi:hypothetical protein